MNRILYQLFVAVLVASESLTDGLKDTVKSYIPDWLMSGAAVALVIAALVFICCCALPKVVKYLIFAAAAGTAGYYAFKKYGSYLTASDKDKP